jgi:hypothetical protein
LQKGLGKLKQSVFNLKKCFYRYWVLEWLLRGLVNAGMQIENLGVQIKMLYLK